MKKPRERQVSRLFSSARRGRRNQRKFDRFTVGKQQCEGEGKPGKGSGKRKESIPETEFVTYLASDPANNVPVRESSFSVMLHLAMTMGLYAMLVYFKPLQATWRARRRP